MFDEKRSRDTEARHRRGPARASPPDDDPPARQEPPNGLPVDKTPTDHAALFVAVVSLSVGLLLFIPYLDDLSAPDRRGMLGLALAIYIAVVYVLKRQAGRFASAPRGQSPASTAPTHQTQLAPLDESKPND